MFSVILANLNQGFGPAYMSANIESFFWVVSYTKIVEKAKNLCAYVGFSKYFVLKTRKIQFLLLG